MEWITDGCKFTLKCLRKDWDRAQADKMTYFGLVHLISPRNKDKVFGAHNELPEQVSRVRRGQA